MSRMTTTPGDSFRPYFHFTPPDNWMNDPNGLVYFDGEYHLFYQHNPFDIIWGHMSWGHAISTDLVHWQHLPVALHEENEIMIFSGCAVVDWQNSSGFSSELRSGSVPPLVIIYTEHRKGNQAQNLAYSFNRGRNWIKYSGNPVLDIHSSEFRDPKVFWHAPTQLWIMVVALSVQHQLRFYGSSDLKHWEFLSEFGPAGATESEWECPDLFPLPVEGYEQQQKWVLKVDVSGGAVAGGSGGQYFIGQFDGTIFVNDNPKDQIHWIDYGQDFYAAQSWSDIPLTDGSRLWLGWMSNWQYAQVIPTHPWKNAQSFPRRVTLREYPEGVRLVQNPADEIKHLRQQHYHWENLDVARVNKRLRENYVAATALEIEVEFELRTASEFGLKVRKGIFEETVIGYDAVSGQLFVDRGNSGNVEFSSKFQKQQRGELVAEQGKVKLRILIDQCSVEVFGNDGKLVITDLIFPSPQSQGVELFANSGDIQIKVLDVWILK